MLVEGKSFSCVDFGEVAIAAAMGAVGGGVVDKLGKLKKLKDKTKSLSKAELKSVRSYEKLIKEHQQKIKDFKANPTVRPGMEHLPKEVIQKQWERRVLHLEREIKAFNDNIQKILNSSGG